jgi:competence protein ComEA
VDRSWIVASCIAATSLVGALVLWPRPSPEPIVDIVAPTSAGGTTAITVVVHVSGAVARPGLVSLPVGARVADAIVAAGGAMPDAALSTLNLATPVIADQHVVVPWNADGAGPGRADGAADGGRVPINRADASALLALPGIGPVLAARIVEHRERHGPFTTAEDLLGVPGIGEVTLAALRDHIVVP